MNNEDLLPIGEFHIGYDVAQKLLCYPVRALLTAHAEGDSGTAVRNQDDMLAQATAFGFGGPFESKHHLPDGAVLRLRTAADRSQTTSELLSNG